MCKAPNRALRNRKDRRIILFCLFILEDKDGSNTII